MNTLLKRLFAVALAAAWSTTASAVPLLFSNVGDDGQTTVFRAGLGGIVGLSQLGSVVIADSNSGTGGSNGVFSGFDLDFVFLDLDGNYATTGDRVFGSSFAFTTGAIRLPTSPGFNEPTLLRPGPTIGSSAANTIDPGRATLNVRDGFFPGGFNTDNVSGWLTLGDAGLLAVEFGAAIVLTGNEALFIGEVGTSPGELVSASVNASENRIPEPGTLVLAGLGLLSLAGRRRRT